MNEVVSNESFQYSMQITFRVASWRFSQQEFTELQVAGFDGDLLSCQNRALQSKLHGTYKKQRAIQGLIYVTFLVGDGQFS